MQDEVVQREHEFTQALVTNDAEVVGRFLTDDWMIIDADGGIIERAHFLHVIQSGALTHERMESEDLRVRLYGTTAIVTALTTTTGRFNQQVFTTQERATDVFVLHQGQWLCALSHLTSLTKK